MVGTNADTDRKEEEEKEVEVEEEELSRGGGRREGREGEVQLQEATDLETGRRESISRAPPSVSSPNHFLLFIIHFITSFFLLVLLQCQWADENQPSGLRQNSGRCEKSLDGDKLEQECGGGDRESAHAVPRAHVCVCASADLMHGAFCHTDGRQVKE